MANLNEVKGTPIEALNQHEAFFLKHKKNILIAVAALIIIIAGYFCYNNFISGPKEEKASTELAKGQEYFANQQFDVALNGDKAGYAGMLNIISEYGGTDAANLANLYAGLCYAKLDKWNEAVKYLDSFSPADDQMISPTAIAALGNAYAHVKELDKAVKYLKKAASMADAASAEGVNNSFSPTFLIQAAEILESQGNKEEALKIYQDIKAKYLLSPVSNEIDKYIERASN